MMVNAVAVAVVSKYAKRDEPFFEMNGCYVELLDYNIGNIVALLRIAANQFTRDVTAIIIHPCT